MGKTDETTPASSEILALLFKNALKPNAIKQLVEHFDWKCWSYICTSEEMVCQLSANFFIKHANKISNENWSFVLSRSEAFPKDLLLKHARHVKDGKNWSYMCSSRREDIDETFINTYIDRMDTVTWYSILFATPAQHPEHLLERFSHMFDVHCWAHILEYQHGISLEFIDRHVDKFNARCWRNIATEHRDKLSLEFIEKHTDRFSAYDWELLTIDGRISQMPDEFFTRHGHRFNTIAWRNVLYTRSAMANLSEKFLEENGKYFDTECWDTAAMQYQLTRNPLPDSIRAMFPASVYSDMENFSDARVFK